jgi:hypothetical protein
MRYLAAERLGLVENGTQFGDSRLECRPSGCPVPTAARQAYPLSLLDIMRTR